MTNVNDVAPVITSSDSGTALAESMEVATTTAVYSATATPDVAGATVSWSFKDNNNDDAGLFDINSSSGAVTFAQATTPDYEDKDSYSFTIIATTGGLSSEKTVTIAVTDVNDMPPVFAQGTQATITIDDRTTTFDGVTYQAVADVASVPVTYKIEAITGKEADITSFQIDATTGELTAASNAEFVRATKSSYEFNIIATAGSQTATQKVVVTVAPIEQSDFITLVANDSVNKGDIAFGTSSTDVIDGTEFQDFINTGSGDDTITTNNSVFGGDIIIGGYGKDTITLEGANGGGIDQLIYRFDSTDWTATDGGDVVNAFNLTVDKLLFVDVAALDGVSSVNDFIDGLIAAGGSIRFTTDTVPSGEANAGASYIDGIIFTFAKAGTIDGADNTASSGKSLTLNFSPTINFTKAVQTTQSLAAIIGAGLTIDSTSSATALATFKSQLASLTNDADSNATIDVTRDSDPSGLTFNEGPSFADDTVRTIDIPLQFSKIQPVTFSASSHVTGQSVTYGLEALPGGNLESGFVNIGLDAFSIDASTGVLSLSDTYANLTLLPSGAQTYDFFVTATVNGTVAKHRVTADLAPLPDGEYLTLIPEGDDRGDVRFASGSDDTVDGTQWRDRIDTSYGDDVITTNGGGDIIVGGRGSDTITLEGDYKDQIIYRFNSVELATTKWYATDGSDVIHDFDLSEDKLLLLDELAINAVLTLDQFIDDLLAAGGSFAFATTDDGNGNSYINQLKIIFVSNGGDVSNGYGTASDHEGKTLTVNFKTPSDTTDIISATTSLQTILGSALTASSSLNEANQALFKTQFVSLMTNKDGDVAIDASSLMAYDFAKIKDVTGPAFTEGAREISLAEGESFAAQTYQATHDTRADSTISFSLIGRDADKFSINSSTGILTAKAGTSFDYETQSHYLIYVVASFPVSTGLPQAEQRVDITVTNVEDTAPTITSSDSGSIKEGSLIATTESIYNATGTYDITAITWSLKRNNNDDADLFKIDSTTGAVTFNASLRPDYGAKQSYKFTIVATAASQFSAVEKDVTITVLEAPFTISSDANVASLTNGKSVDGDFVVYDADSTSAAISWSLLSNNDDDASSFEINRTTGEVTFIATSTTPSYSGKDSYKFTVIAEHDGFAQLQEINVKVNAFDVPSATKSGTNASDNVAGTSVSETLQGGAHNDVITTGGGGDTVIGGYGNDTITLGDGVDTVVVRFDSNADGEGSYQLVDGGDVINNFEFGVDRLVFVDVNDGNNPVKDISKFGVGAADSLSVTPILLLAEYGGLATGVTFEFGLQGSITGDDNGARTEFTVKVNFDTTDTSNFITAIGTGQQYWDTSKGLPQLVNYGYLDEVFGGSDSILVIDDDDLPSGLTIL